MMELEQFKPLLEELGKLLQEGLNSTEQNIGRNVSHEVVAGVIEYHPEGGAHQKRIQILVDRQTILNHNWTSYEGTDEVAVKRFLTNMMIEVYNSVTFRNKEVKRLRSPEYIPSEDLLKALVRETGKTEEQCITAVRWKPYGTITEWLSYLNG